MATTVAPDCWIEDRLLSHWLFAATHPKPIARVHQDLDNDD
jgi:hypothetical protein